MSFLSDNDDVDDDDDDDDGRRMDECSMAFRAIADYRARRTYTICDACGNGMGFDISFRYTLGVVARRVTVNLPIYLYVKYMVDALRIGIFCYSFFFSFNI